MTPFLSGRLRGRLGAALCAGLCVVAGRLPAAPGDASVILATGEVLEGVQFRPGPSADRLVLEQPGQMPRTLPVQDLLAVDFGKLPGRPSPPTVRMAGGDQVYGKVSFPAQRQVKVAAGWGSITVPLARCALVRLTERTPTELSVSRDTLITRNDRVEGEIQGVIGGKVRIDINGSPVLVDLARVDALALAPRPQPETPPGLLIALDLGGGERLTGRWVEMDPDLLTLRMDWGGLLQVPVASLSRLDVKNGRLVYLTDLRPSEIRETPFLDGSFPMQMDRAVSGRPLRLGGRTYSRGLGMHSRCEATFALDGGFATFEATIGVDDGVAPRGSVIFRVYADQNPKPSFESRVMRGGDRPEAIRVPIRGVLLLRLEADYADQGDVADHANWADARLLRP